MKAIGGYFELELSRRTKFPYPSALRYQSARAAFEALVQFASPSRVWVPRYICDSMLDPLKKLGAKYEYYSIGADFRPAEDMMLQPSDLLLYVNYFGVCDEVEAELLKRFNPKQVVLDHSQAFFSVPKECLATIYSPRKFFGVPDGGLLTTDLDIQAPLDIDRDSLNYLGHLVKRLTESAEAGYRDFQHAEARLSYLQPMRMSALTEALLATVDYEGASQTRQMNYHYLHGELGTFNQLQLTNNSASGPMCYPFLPRKKIHRTDLIAKRIYVPQFWSEVLSRDRVTATEQCLVEELIPLPLDQRCDLTDMQFVVDQVRDHLSQ